MPSRYGSRYPITHTAAEARAEANGVKCRVAGRVMLWRTFGKLIFATLRDRSGTIQISLRLNEMDPERFAELKGSVKIGDFLGVDGVRWTTDKGEPTVGASDVEVLSVAMRPLPDKWAVRSTISLNAGAGPHAEMIPAQDSTSSKKFGRKMRILKPVKPASFKRRAYTACSLMGTCDWS